MCDESFGNEEFICAHKEVTSFCYDFGEVKNHIRSPMQITENNYKTPNKHV